MREGTVRPTMAPLQVATAVSQPTCSPVARSLAPNIDDGNPRSKNCRLGGFRAWLARQTRGDMVGVARPPITEAIGSGVAAGIQSRRQWKRERENERIGDSLGIGRIDRRFL